MKNLLPLLFFAWGASAQSFKSDSLILKTAKHHPMQYYVSLPQHYVAGSEYPVVVILEAAEKEFKENALRFVRARKGKPLIIVAPFNVNNSRSGRRDPHVFPYSTATWDRIEKEGDCTFMMDGLTAVMEDVQNDYRSGTKYFITGFEAGAHSVYQMLFQHPERLLAAAVVSGNYNQNSCTQAGNFSAAASYQVPLRSFYGAGDDYFGKDKPIYFQWANAKKDALVHGFTRVDEVSIKGKQHEPLPDEVLQWFDELYSAMKKAK